MHNITIESVRALYSDSEFVALVEDVKRCRAEAARVRKVVDAYTLPVFESFDLVDDFTGEKIERMEDAWNASDESFSAYNDKCIEAAHAAGFAHLGDSCPALVAENKRSKAESALVEMACAAWGFGRIYNLDLSNRLLSMLMKQLRD